jgi:hypothetical protein
MKPRCPSCAKPPRLMPVRRRRGERPVRSEFIIEIFGRLLMSVARRDRRIGSRVRITGSLDKPMMPLGRRPPTPLRGFAGGESQLIAIGAMTWSAPTCGRVANPRASTGLERPTGFGRL